MISFTLVLATGVKLIMIPFASARGPKAASKLTRLIIAESYFSRTGVVPCKQLGLPAFDKPLRFAYNTMHPCDIKSP
jgi:hypothetical protein